MPSKVPEWRKFELDCQEALGLHDTIASGSKFHDPGDGVTGHYSEDELGIIIDAKTTEKGSYSVKADMINDWIDRSQLLGKMFLLPLRFTQHEVDDLVVLRLNDLVALVEWARKGMDGG